jgi:pyridoxamine 5'-phosphate oxidase-like protein
VSWARLEVEAPELARLGRERLAGGLALLGTVRADGSPRVSPIGVFFLDDDLVIGVMTRSGKARDLRRDPRVAVQSVVTAPDEGEPELKLYGRVEPSHADGGWWEGARPGVDVYALVLEQAEYVEWDLEGEMVGLRRWRPGRGEGVSRRAYP